MSIKAEALEQKVMMTAWIEGAKALIESETKPMTELKRHHHADVIIAWAEGKQIQIRDDDAGVWLTVGENPYWSADRAYRVKPEPRPDVIKYFKHSAGTSVFLESWLARKAGDAANSGDLRITRDGETGEIKSVELMKPTSNRVRTSTIGEQP